MSRPASESRRRWIGRPPAEFARWTSPLIASALGDVHVQQVRRLLRVQELDLAARRSWCESTDRQFVARSTVVVICVDEKPSIQALEPAQGI